MPRLKHLRYLLEAAFVGGVFALSNALPLERASALGGWLGRKLGMHLGATKVAKRNLDLAFPDMSEEEKARILLGMWDNIGRSAAEFPHLASDDILSRITVEGEEHLQRAVEKGAGIIYSGHFGNWEVAARAAGAHHVTLGLVYRHANNPYVEKMVFRVRETFTEGLFAKGSKGAMQIVRRLRSGKWVGMLMDQKMNQGMAIPFFGRDAMTATAIADFAKRFDASIVPTRIVREKNAHFRLIVYPPLTFTDTKDLLTQINALFEIWVREYPEQWLWIHRRWPKESA